MPHSWVSAHVDTVIQFKAPCTARERGTKPSHRCPTFFPYRSLAGKKDKKAGKLPQLDPGPCLENFKVVIVGTRKAASVGVVARALGGFECLSLCCVAPRAKVNSGRSLKTSCGAQYIINNAQVCDTLEEALQGSSYSVAFSRWISGAQGFLLPCTRCVFHAFCWQRSHCVHAPHSLQGRTTSAQPLGLYFDKTAPCIP